MKRAFRVDASARFDGESAAPSGETNPNVAGADPCRKGEESVVATGRSEIPGAIDSAPVDWHST